MVLNTSVGRRVLVAFAIAAGVIAVGNVGRAQRGGGGPAGPQVTQSVPELRFRYVGPAVGGPRRVGRRRARRSDDVLPRRGVGRRVEDPPTAARRGSRSSTAAGPGDRLARGGAAPIQIRCGPARARHGSFATATSAATAFTSRPTRARRGRTSALPDAGRIGRIIVHPTNPNIVYACVDRARHRAAAGARRVPHDSTAARRGSSRSSSIRTPAVPASRWIRINPDVLLAGMWQVELHTWAMFSGGPGSGVYLTLDGGKTWTKATTGMPRSPVGKIDVAIAPSNPQRMYALIQTANQGIAVAIGRRAARRGRSSAGIARSSAARATTSA